MSDEKNTQKDDLAEVNNLEIEPLSDEDLDSASGGLDRGLLADCTGCGTNEICT
jgi:hypothetical protein